MPTFQYKARDSSGRDIVALTSAPSRSEATESLRGRELLILELRELDDDSAASTPRPARVSSWRRPRTVAVEVALRQLGVMLRSGLTLLESLRTAAMQSSSKRMRAILLAITDRIQAGNTLEEAMSQHRCFGRLTLSLVRVGEQTGELDEVLIRASESMERRRLMRAKLVGAMLYPGVVFVAAIGATLFMLTFAIPRISVYLRSSGRELPAMTRYLVDASDFVRIQWPWILVGLLAGSVALYVTYRTPFGRMLFDRAALRLPLMGTLLRTSATASLARVLEQMTRSGITIVESLKTAETLHHNAYIRRVLDTARRTVLQGDALAPSLMVPSALAPMLGSMVAVGEQSGTLERVLGETAEFHEHRLESMIQLLSTAVEVAVVVVVGAIVGYVYIAFMLALYQAATP